MKPSSSSVDHLILLLLLLLCSASSFEFASASFEADEGLIFGSIKDVSQDADLRTGSNEHQRLTRDVYHVRVEREADEEDGSGAVEEEPPIIKTEELGSGDAEGSADGSGDLVPPQGCADFQGGCDSSCTSEDGCPSATQTPPEPEDQDQDSTEPVASTSTTTAAPIDQGCSVSEFGCCYDNVTSRRGASENDCPCQATRFGCCPDGVSKTQ